jgi:hypothetical protein
MIACKKRVAGVKAALRWIVFVAASLSACSGPTPNGILEVRIKDHREAIEDFSNAVITIEAVRISPKVGLKFWKLGWVDLVPSVARVDLTASLDRSAAMVVRRELTPGSFEALDLKLSGISGVLKKDSASVMITNKISPVVLPFSIDSGELTTIIIDLAVMDMSDHPPRAYELQLSGYEVYRNGKLIDRVPPG